MEFFDWQGMVMIAYLVLAVIAIAGVVVLIKRRKGDWNG